MEEMKFLGRGYFEIDMNDVRLLPITVARLRNLAQKRMVTSGPGDDARYMPTQNELDTIGDMLEYAVNHGQVIDFGYWPNEMIKTASGHGGKLYTNGAIAHPFSTPYVIMHLWDDLNHPMNDLHRKRSCIYLVNPLPHGKEVYIDFEAMEFECFNIAGGECLGIGDRITFHAELSAQSHVPTCSVIPFAYRFPEMMNSEKFKSMMTQGITVLEASLSNVVDPVMCALAILNTRGVKTETIHPSPALAKARAKTGKPIIPPYRQVDSSGYVTAILARKSGARSESQGGTHASPIPHVRMGHVRHYKSGERSIIRDTLVNATDDMRETFKSNRSHYVVKPE